MKKLTVRIEKDVYGWLSKLAGEQVEVVAVTRDCWKVKVRMARPKEAILADRPELKPSDLEFGGKPVSLLLRPEEIEWPVDDVPESHRGSKTLVQAWMVTEIRNDAWHRNPPSDPEWYEKEYGEKWTDKRVYDVGRC